MVSNQQAEWQQEQERVDHVMKVIREKAEQLEQHTKQLKDEIIDIRKTFWEEVTIDPDEVAETFFSIKQQTAVLNERERSYRQAYRQRKVLAKLEESPYFGRFDFREDGARETERIYVGVASLLDEKEEDFLVYDWRAPISSLYYDYAPGPAKYDIPDGTISGEMKLKRQFIIREGRIKHMFDTGVTIGDVMLQEVLGSHSDTQMKNIVATIQQEQNRLIRNERKNVLIVQGVAGSGKTSAALQRVAYLLYRYRQKLNASQILLFSPNPLFNSYVSTVLPELGEENMQQTTFQEYIEYRLGRLFRVEDPFSQLEYLLANQADADFPVRCQAMVYKAGLDFKALIDEYVAELGKAGLIFKDIALKDKVLIPKEEVARHFYGLDNDISIPNRMEKTAEWILDELNKKERLEREADWVSEEMQFMDEEELKDIYRKANRNRMDTVEDAAAGRIVQKHFAPLRKAVKQLAFLDMPAVYGQLFLSTQKRALTEHWREICAFTLQKLQSGELPYEDAIPFLYLQDRLEGNKPNTAIKHLFIDEAQDYSPFQLAYLRQLFPSSRMTILGDVNQAINAQSIGQPTILSPELYGAEETEVIALTKTYRSTKQIVEFTRQLIPDGGRIEPFERQGPLPTLSEADTYESLHAKIVGRIGQLRQAGRLTIAVICKTAAESGEAFAALRNKVDARLIEKDTLSFEKGVLVLPAYLAKGIEFDAVIIYNGSNEQYGQEFERRLFYTACTRAMHELHIFSLGRRTFMLDGVRPETYTVE